MKLRPLMNVGRNIDLCLAALDLTDAYPILAILRYGECSWLDRRTSVPPQPRLTKLRIPALS